MSHAAKIQKLAIALMASAALSLAQAATPLDEQGARACEDPGARALTELRIALWRAHVNLPLTALAVAARDGAGVIARRTYLPLGVELLAAADPRGAPTWLRIDRATRMHTSPESGGPRLLMVTERRRRIADFAVVNFGDLEPTKLRLAFSLPHPSFRVHSVAVCVVDVAAWSADEYLPKAR